MYSRFFPLTLCLEVDPYCCIQLYFIHFDSSCFMNYLASAPFRICVMYLLRQNPSPFSYLPHSGPVVELERLWVLCWPQCILSLSSHPCLCSQGTHLSAPLVVCSEIEFLWAYSLVSFAPSKCFCLDRSTLTQAHLMGLFGWLETPVSRWNSEKLCVTHQCSSSLATKFP